MTDPLILDLDGDGIELQVLDRRSASFDIDGDGVAERTAWVGADDGLLARDLDGSGAIEGIDELFGQADQSGFAALSALDSTGDGIIDVADAAFATLLIWRDADGDAVTDQGELQTLTEAGESVCHGASVDLESRRMHFIDCGRQHTWSVDKSLCGRFSSCETISMR